MYCWKVFLQSLSKPKKHRTFFIFEAFLFYFVLKQFFLWYSLNFRLLFFIFRYTPILLSQWIPCDRHNLPISFLHVLRSLYSLHQVITLSRPVLSRSVLSWLVLSRSLSILGNDKPLRSISQCQWETTFKNFFTHLTYFIPIKTMF